MIIGTGAGTRARHAYSVGIDQGMPTGVLGLLGTFVSIQNAKMIHYLLTEEGVPYIEPGGFSQLPLYLKQCNAVVFFGMPPYTYWQRSPEVGKIPPYRTDTGCYLISEAYGTKNMIYIKDVDGLYTNDPKKDKNAVKLPELTYLEVLQKGLKVMDATATSLCMDNNLPMIIFDMTQRDNIKKVVHGEKIGTIVQGGDANG